MTTLAVQKALIALAEEMNGELTPELVLERARQEDSPLHGHFTWDQAKAAYERNLDQARSLIRSVKVVIKKNDVVYQVPFFVRNPVAAETGAQGYSSLKKLRTNTDIAKDAVRVEFERADAAMNRAQKVAMALALDTDITEIKERLDAVIRKIDGEE